MLWALPFPLLREATGMGTIDAKNTTVGELILLEWRNTWKKIIGTEALQHMPHFQEKRIISKQTKAE